MRVEEGTYLACFVLVDRLWSTSLAEWRRT